MQTIDKTEQEIIDEFSIYDDWMDKYAVIIEQGNALAPLDEQYKTPSTSLRVPGFMLWLQATTVTEDSVSG